jgi:glycosyltransferase involved in cell wall biosynthesis
MPKVSIILPIYNAEEYLEECLDSIINQTLKDIEIICVNDGSKDNSLAIIQKYASLDERIKIIDKSNSGYGHTMNIGLEKATGEYIGIVEPDDYIALDMYETLYNNAIEKDLDLVKADFYRFKGTIDNRTFFYAKLDLTDKYYNKILNPTENLDIFKLVMNTWSGIYKKSFIEKYHIRHNETAGASFQDNGFWFQTFMFAERVYFLNKPFYMNRRDNPNSSVKNRSKVFAMQHEYEFIRSIIEANKDILEKFIPIWTFKKFQNYYFTYRRIDETFEKEFLQVFQSEFKELLEKNEIDFNFFSNNEKEILLSIIKSPEKFRMKKFHNLSLLEKIFSIKNWKNHKYLIFFGKNIKIK